MLKKLSFFYYQLLVILFLGKSKITRGLNSFGKRSPNGGPRNYLKSILQMRSYVLGKLCNLQYIFAVILKHVVFNTYININANGVIYFCINSKCPYTLRKVSAHEINYTHFLAVKIMVLLIVGNSDHVAHA